MDLETINYLSQTVAAFGVIISIIYFARKLKQNTKASRIKASHLTSKELRNSLGMVAKNNSLAEIFAKASISEDLTNVEKLRWYTYIGSTMRIFENSYALMEKKDLSQDYWRGMEAMLIDITKMKAFNLFWKDRKHLYSEIFRNYVENTIFKMQSPENISIPGNYNQID